MTEEKTIDEQLEEVEHEELNKGENYYSRQLNKVYGNIRKSLVLIKRASKNIYKDGKREKNKEGKFIITKGKLVKPAEITKKQACEKAKEILLKAVDLLE